MTGELEKRVRKFIKESVYNDINEELVICEDEVSLHDIFEESRKEFPLIDDKHFKTENPTRKQMEVDIKHAIDVATERYDWFKKWFSE